MKSNLSKIIVVIALITAITVVMIAKNKKSPGRESISTEFGIAGDANSGNAETQLPRLVDVGSTTCVPCKVMAAVLAELSREYSKTLEVVFVNIKDTEKAEPYKIRVMPTQIFYDRNGSEFWRHEGVLSKEEILQKFKEHGIVLTND